MKKGHFIYKKNHKLAYRVYGEGTRTVFAFHGFGQNASVFERLPHRLPDHRIISFDLPYHGSTEFPEEKLTKSRWKDLSNELLRHFQVSEVDVIAYSLGGRFAIRMAIDHPEKVKMVTFIAADGFFYTGIYRFATSAWGRRLFRKLLKNPSRLFRFSEWLSSGGILNPSIVKFAKLQLGEKEQRIRVYNSWLYLRGLMTSQKELIDSLKQSRIPVSIYAGSRDYVIKDSYFSKLVRSYSGAQKAILPKRHHEMISGYINYETGNN